MPTFKGLFRYIVDSDYRFRTNARRGLYDSMSDDEYLRRQFKAQMGKELDLENPHTLNEKLQWLKIHDRKETYHEMVDKYKAKQYVANLIGDEYIIPTLGVWNNANDIDFKSLPDKFVLKCTHDSHGLIICRDKSKLDIQKTRKIMNHALKQDYYLRFREWPYKDVPHRIIAEQYMEDEEGTLTDYKFYCFNGKVDCVLTCFDRMSGNVKYYFFDREWNLKRYNKMGQQAPEGFSKPKPKNINKMFELAETLAIASKAPFIRVDLYNIDGNIYFGELTLYPGSGFDRGRLTETDILFGNMLRLETDT